MNLRRLAAAGASAVALLLAACGGGGGGIGGTGSAAGTMRVSLTDAPACGYDAVHVTVQKVRVHQSSTAGEGDAGWREIVLSAPRRIDLLTLQNGVLDELGQTALPAGTYTQLRLVLAENSATDPLANAVTPTGGTETPLDTPSAQQSGLKMNVSIDVPAGQVVDVVLDFDACKSVVRRGNSGQFNLKPVVTVIPVLSAVGQRIVGWVDPAVATGGTVVSAQVGGVPAKATTPAADGSFVLSPLPAGTYDVVMTSSGRVTLVMTGVPVTIDAPTAVNSTSLRFLPPLLSVAPRNVTGTVAPADGSVRATQALTGGPTIELDAMNVDALDGTFDFLLPIDATQRTAWVASPTSITFTADTGSAGKYTLEATSGGLTQSSPLLDTTAVVPPVDFTFP